MGESLKATATRGVLWSAVNKFATQFMQFGIGIVLARLLLPSDFGLIGMLSIFIAISSTFIDSGMNSGLIQKQQRTDVDFSTVFVFNLVISAAFYLLLFISAPLIASFFNQPTLVPLTRVLGLNLIINAVAIVQRSKLTIAIDFKSLAIVQIVGVFVGGGVGLIVAFYGFGVWSLVIQTLLGALASTITLWYMSKWTPSLTFSKDSFKRLFGYGSKLLLAGLYAQAFHNIYNISIGKSYPAAELGYYTRTKNFADMTSGTIANILKQVTFPILAGLQDDKERMVSIYRKLIRMTSFFVFPVMVLLAILAEPIVMLLLTKKWATVIPLLQWMAFARLFYPISGINMNILNAVGRSDLFLKVDLSKAPLIIIALVITIPLGVKAVVIGHVVVATIAFFINAYLPGKYFGYGAIEQLKDMLPIFFMTIVMAIPTFMVIQVFDNYYVQIALGCTVAFMVYGILSYLLKMEELKELKTLIYKFKK
ncbi:lipopolysaccharide biosynthesis protein [uncultured Marivirga sp.]|uniref:lipopolysaccharide biosynthesis protein n=1 Tax=uncultured Marivirga sp. TaxID=1123707 RepID=UPI0030EC02A8